MKGLGLSPGMVNVLCSWARHFYLHSASFHSGVWMGISELAEKPAEMLKGNLVKVWYPTQGERGGWLVILLVASSKISSGCIPMYFQIRRFYFTRSTCKVKPSNYVNLHEV